MIIPSVNTFNFYIIIIVIEIEILKIHMRAADSSENICIEKCNISSGHDAIVLKSGWDEYGMSYAKPTMNVHIRNVRLESSSGAGLAFGSEMSGGISTVISEHLHVLNSYVGIKVKTTKGRGGYIKNIFISDARLQNINMGLSVDAYYGSHPHEDYDPSALPFVGGITFDDVVGENIKVAGNFSGLADSPFASICLSNVTFSISSESSSSSSSWVCSNVNGFSREVLPEPCPDLQSSSSFSSCFIASASPSTTSYVSSL